MRRHLLPIAATAVLLLPGCRRTTAPRPSHKKAPSMLVSAKLQDQLLAAQRTEIAAHHDLHTRNLLPDGTPKYVNRLILSSSPYLRQHAHNPVQWFPWGDEAFNLARKLHRPVFLSVGYATCHWCHVMADESFEDEQIARYLNDHFISIKIDREQRPDLDSHFMKAVQQMLNGRGGWPMSVWLTPDREPFFARTYVPARDGDRGIPTGFLSLLERIATHYEKDPKSVTMTAKHFGAALRDLPPVISTPAQLDAQKTIDSAIKVASWLYDNVHGGPKGAPKFPSTFPSRLLLRQSTFGDPDHTLLTMAERTLDGMADGGLRDQLGGGFHRYSVDDRWHVPHFEKMLYDNAQLAVTYLEAVQVTGNQRYARVARGVLDDVMREMTAPSGGFCSALDADSLDPAGHKVEGWFYTWTPKEFADVLGPKQGRAMAELFGVTTAGDVDGRSVLRRAQSESVVAQIVGVEASDAPKLVRTSIEQLRKARENRPKPQRDDKVLTSWNGLMIEALALGSRVLGDEKYRDAAEKAAAVVLADRSPDGRLAHSRLGANVERMDFIDDYAMLASGLLALFQATSDIKWLNGAISLELTARAHFWDEQRHLFRLVAKERQDIAGAQYPVQDGPVPSGNAMMAWVELQLESLTENEAYGELADKLLGALSKSASRSPHGHTDLMLAVQLRARPMKQAVVVRADESTGESELTRVLWRTLAPGAVKVVASQGQVNGALGEALPWMKGKTVKKGKDTAYVCTNRGCKAPTTEGKVLREQLKAP